MKKRLITMALALSMILAMIPVQAASLPGDVSGSWCKDYVSSLMGKGIVGGYSDGTYRPTAPVSRGAIAKMAFLTMQAAGSSLKESTENAPFSDMKGNWAEGYAAILANTGNLLPSEFGYKYEASKDMTRLETAKLLTRIYIYAHPDVKLDSSAKLDFSDTTDLSASDASLVAKAVELGIINGYKDGTFKPNASINRGTAAAMISRFLGTVGTISDPAQFVNSSGGNGSISADTTGAPKIQGVEWVIKPSIKIDYQGTAINSQFSKFSRDGVASYSVKDNDPNPVFVDIKGKTYQYADTRVNYLEGFRFGYAAAEKISTGKYGIIDMSGRWVVAPEYDKVRGFDYTCYNDGSKIITCAVQKNDAWTTLDRNFDVIENFQSRNADIDWGATDAVNNERSYMSVSVDGETAYEAPTTGGLMTYSKMLGTGGLRKPYYGIRDTNGRVIVRPTAMTSSYGTDSLHGSYSTGSVYDDCIVLTHDVSIRFDAVSDVYDGATGQLLYSYANTPEAATQFGVDYRYVGNNCYGQGLFITVPDSTKRLGGYMDKHGNMIIPAVFEDAHTFSNGYAWVKYNGLWGVIKLPQF